MEKQAAIKFRKMTPFVKATNNINYLGLTLTKTMNDLYDNYFRLLNKEVDENSDMEKSPMLLD